MGPLLAIACGAVCGIAAAAPLLLLLQRQDSDLGRGFGAVIAAFAVIQLSLFAVHALFPGLVAHFGVTATLAFLVCTMVAVARSQVRR